ncbi:heavy-metal-associated domain-containing protein, partial [Staphylococcus pseudintermedius]
MIQSRKTYRIEGLSCANCAGKFERNVRGLASVEEAQVNFGASKIYVTGDPTVEELEGAGAFENLKLTLDERKKISANADRSTMAQPTSWFDKVKQFYKAHQSICVATLF